MTIVVISKRIILVEVTMSAHSLPLIEAACNDLANRFLARIPKHRMGQLGHAEAIAIHDRSATVLPTRR
jgi:hypothetical protein